MRSVQSSKSAMEFAVAAALRPLPARDSLLSLLNQIQLSHLANTTALSTACRAEAAVMTSREAAELAFTASAKLLLILEKQCGYIRLSDITLSVERRVHGQVRTCLLSAHGANETQLLETSVIVERDTNGDSTGSYSLALAPPEVAAAVRAAISKAVQS